MPRPPDPSSAPAASPDGDWPEPPPSLPDGQRHRAQSWLRYEDIAQDGRLKLLALAHTLGPGVWQKLGDQPIVREAGRGGVIPVLTRLLLEGGDVLMTSHEVSARNGNPGDRRDLPQRPVDRVRIGVEVGERDRVGEVAVRRPH